MKLMIEGRVAWPVFFMAVFSTLTILLTDIAWREINVSILTVCLAGGALLVVGNALIYFTAKAR